MLLERNGVLYAIYQLLMLLCTATGLYCLVVVFVILKLMFAK